MSETAPMSAPEDCEHLAGSFEANVREYREKMRVKGVMDSTLGTYVRYVLLAARGLYLGGRDPDEAEAHEWELVRDPLEWSEDELYALTSTRWWGALKDGTRNLAKAALKSYYKIHRRTDLAEDPVFFSRRRRGGGSRRRDLMSRSLPDAEFVELLEECRRVVLDPNASRMDVWRHYCCYLQASLGLRDIAVSNISLGDVHLDENYVHIDRDKGEQVHDVPLDVPMRDEYERFMSAREGIIADLLAKHGGDRTIVAKLHALSRAGAPLFFGTYVPDNFLERREPRHIGKSNSAVAMSVLGHRVNAHMFRHSKIFHLLDVKGWDIHRVSKYIGHSTIEMTYSYLDMDLDALQEGIRRDNGAPEPAPVATGGVMEAKMRLLAEMRRDGLLDDSAFAAAVAALQ